MAEPMISVRDLRKSFGPVEALRGVSVDIPPGGIVGLLGPNGAGKSTLIRVLLGLLRPSSGSSRVLGFDSVVSPLDIRSRVGYMPEDDCHIPGLSAVGYVAYAAELSGLPPDDAIRRAHEALDYVGMDEERYRLVETYSAGMRQRIKLAQAVVHDPEVLFLDEPTDGMDPTGRAEMLELIRDIARLGGVSILVSSHMLHDVEAVCGRIVVLGMGTVRLEGDLASLRLTTGNRYDLRLKGDPNRSGFLAALREIGGEARTDGDVLKVALPTGMAAKKLVELALAKRIQIRHLRRSHNTLEEVFAAAVADNTEAVRS
jgi:ABC-2 type transport system ATP-binding protein